MKIPNTVYLILAIISFLIFVDSLFDKGSAHELLFWNANIWVYRLFRLSVALLFFKIYFDKRRSIKTIETK